MAKATLKSYGSPTQEMQIGYHSNYFFFFKGAQRDLRKMVFKVAKFRIDLEASKLIGVGEHQLVIQYIHREHTGEYKCQVADHTVHSQRAHPRVQMSGSRSYSTFTENLPESTNVR
jgi:hypothetical protein